ncbi:MAG TPA: glycoside hydrolase family 3 N-terminal domain-containing protein [Anaerolineae bacterium]|nr:glycoside hydrolase family 3 N-terminal domain-containing protein [Anaerolineae bacterium]
MRTRVLLRGVMALLLLLLIVPPVRAQTPTPDPVLSDAIVNMLSQMPPEMKVGQLVLISFPGMEIEADSDLAELIRDYGVGGVLLHPQNGNFGTTPAASASLISMTNQLQMYASEAAQTFALKSSEAQLNPPFIPLLIATEATIQGVPVTQFISGTSALPTYMALGATWNPALATATGEVLGRELMAVGVNMLLGPDLDVLYTPRPGDPSDLGTNSFGSDPFWVGEMGRAYISGLREGSGGKLLIVPRHLPGLGSADRVLEEEVPTVQKTLEELKQIDLAPFFAVAKNPPGMAVDVADAFLVTHIRYRGFQGNIRQATRPISLDAQALQSVTNLPEIAPWRQGGGVLVADDLGMRSIRRSYDPRGLSFNARLIMQDALNAGNDLLILDRFAAEADWDGHFSNVRSTLEFLTALYKTDLTFKTMVDGAVARLLAMKLRACPEFALASVLQDPLTPVFTAKSDISVQVAAQALTRIFPISKDLLSEPPQSGESIVIFVQEQSLQLPDANVSLALLSADAWRQSLFQLYGPEGTAIVQQRLVQVYTFADLLLALETKVRLANATPTPSPTPTPVALEAELPVTVTVESTPPPVPFPVRVLTALEEARWLVFVTTGLNSKTPESQALKLFLAQQTISPDTRIFVFSLGPPYELDSTEVSKLDAYYALYASGPAFVEASVRTLFRGLTAGGVSPVDVPALNYYIPLQTMPDANQLIPLDLVDASGNPLTSTEGIMLNNLIYLRAGKILDKNGHSVPDGTPVEFVLSYPQEGTKRTVTAVTRNGIAGVQVMLDRVGLMVITAQSEPALSSVRLELTMREEQGVEVVPITPTPTATPTATPTPSPTLTSTPTPTPLPPQVHRLPEPIYLPVVRRSRLLGWGFAGIGLALLGGFLWVRNRGLNVVKSVRTGLWGALGALAGYIAIMIGCWWRPELRHNLSGREYVVGGLAYVTGLLVMLGEGVATFLSARLALARRAITPDDLGGSQNKG